MRYSIREKKNHAAFKKYFGSTSDQFLLPMHNCTAQGNVEEDFTPDFVSVRKIAWPNGGKQMGKCQFLRGTSIVKCNFGHRRLISRARQTLYLVVVNIPSKGLKNYRHFPRLIFVTLIGRYYSVSVSVRHKFNVHLKRHEKHPRHEGQLYGFDAKTVEVRGRSQLR